MHLAAQMANMWRITFLATDRKKALERIELPLARLFVEMLFNNFDRLPRIPFEEHRLEEVLAQEFYVNF